MQGFASYGVQLFRDYVRSYDIVDPWLLSEYLAQDAQGREHALRGAASTPTPQQGRVKAR